MNKLPFRLMGRAVTLTRAGRLLDATRLIQQGLGVLGQKPATRTTPTRPAPASVIERIGALVGSRLPPASETTIDAPERPAGRATFDESVHAHGGLKRHYKLYVPSRVAASPSLMVMLHGCSQDPDDFARGTGMNERAERDGFVVLYPRQSRSDNPMACWNWFDRKDQHRDAGEPGLIADLVRSVVARLGIDPARIYVAGLSAGGAMAAILAAEYPDLFAAAGVHSGLAAGAARNVPDALVAMRKGASMTRGPVSGVAVPTIVFHGDSDRTVHPANGEAVVQSVLARSTAATQALRDAEQPTAAVTRTRHVLADGTTLVEAWTLHGAGHAWAGGRATGSYTDPSGIDATGRMLEFFAAHRRDA